MKLSSNLLTKMVARRFTWKIQKTPNPDKVLLINYKTGERLVANKDQLFGFFYEDWVSHYLPIKPRGNRVLDIGAGWGETIFFYSKHGYQVTTAIEINPVNVSCLRSNQVRHDWRVQIIDRRFDIADLHNLAESYDFVKMDIEGWEYDLLDLQTLPPIILETHSDLTTAEFLKKFPFLKMKDHRNNTAILSNIG